MRNMRKFTISVVLVSALAVLGTAVAAVSASAEPPSVWLCGNELVVAANPCVTVSENLEALTLEDMGVPARIECPPGSVFSYGTVGPGAKDETTKVEFLEEGKKCKPGAKAENLKGEEVANKCEKVEKLEALNLPWKTEIVLEGGVAWDLIMSEPGYRSTCKTLFVNVEDTCIAHEKGENETPLIELVNLTETEAGVLLVSAIFKKVPLVETENANCSIGGKLNGLVFGENLLSAFLNKVLVSLEVSEE
jgi:hypothetical protein